MNGCYVMKVVVALGLLFLIFEHVSLAVRMYHRACATSFSTMCGRRGTRVSACTISTILRRRA